MRGRFVLEQRVAVKEVERGETFERLGVLPDPAEPAMPQHRGGSGVRNRDGEAEAVVVMDLALLAERGEGRIRVCQESGIAGVEHVASVTLR